MSKQAFGLMLLLAVVLSSCAFFRDSAQYPPDFSANSATITTLFENAGPFLYEENGQQGIGVYCGVFEGIHCFYLEYSVIESYDGMWNPDIDNDPTRQISRDTASEIFNPGGWKFVEHSANNAVKIRCQKPNDDAGASLTCELDRGGEWETLPLRVK